MIKEALKLALEALHGSIPHLPLNDEAQTGRYVKALTAIEEALAQPTPAAPRKPLTEQEFEKLYYKQKGYVTTGLMDIVRIVEAAHGIKENT